MPITLNAFPLEVPHQKIEACVIPYHKGQYDALRAGEASYTIRRLGDNILVVSSNGEYPVTGKIESFDLAKNYGLFYFLARDAVKLT